MGQTAIPVSRQAQPSAGWLRRGTTIALGCALRQVGLLDDAANHLVADRHSKKLA